MYRSKWQFILPVVWLLLGLLLPARTYNSGHAQGNERAQEHGALVLVLTADGPVTSAMGEYLARGLRTAEARGAELVIFELNTPGGQINLMQAMVADLRASSVPVVVYVAPPGATAGSAGTVITLAGHAAAMAPETAIGAASPVGPEGQDLTETIETKQKNILKATVRSLAEGRGAEAIALAERTIDEAAAASASEALQAGLIDFIAVDRQDLINQLDGFRVTLPQGERTLATRGAQVEELPKSLIESLLSALTDPNIVFILLTIGVQALLIEISNPGGWVAGFVGVVCLALATYGLGILPVNWFGLVFLATAFVLFVLDIKAPTKGALTTAGVISLIVGALVLFNSPNVPSFQRASVPLIVGVSVASGALFFVALGFALRAQQLPIRTGQEGMIGRTGYVQSELAPRGAVQLGGELWTAELVDRSQKLPVGAKVIVERVEGVRLYVRRVD